MFLACLYFKKRLALFNFVCKVLALSRHEGVEQRNLFASNETIPKKAKIKLLLRVSIQLLLFYIH